MEPSTINSGNTIVNFVFYGLIVAFGTVIILVIIHFTYRPIMGGPASLLSGDEGSVYWEDEDSTTHPDVSANCVEKYYNYSMCFDMIVDDTFTSSAVDKNIITHSAGATNNVRIYMNGSKNDIHFYVNTRDGNQPSEAQIILKNVPIRKEFVVGFVLTEKLMEVYINGALYKTRVFTPAILQPPSSTSQLVFQDRIKATNTPIRVKRLRLWNKVVEPTVMQTYGSVVSPSFKLESDNTVSTCSAE
jgi:hypothetical protein